MEADIQSGVEAGGKSADSLSVVLSIHKYGFKHSSTEDIRHRGWTNTFNHP